MSIAKKESGWLIDIQPGGRGSKRYRKSFSTKAEALAYEAWLKTQVTQTPDWSPAKRDLRRLVKLVDVWYEHHGVNLRAGKDTYNRLKTLCMALGNPIVERFDTASFAAYRKQRLLDGIAPNTLNREHAYLRSVFNECRRLGIWKGDNPLTTIRQIKVVERELSYLSNDDIRVLLKSLALSGNSDILVIAKICLSTGARWSEAEEIKASQIRDGKIHFTNTKSGKNRSVPISPSLEAELIQHIKKRDGFHRLFKSCYFAFRGAVIRSGLNLPEGQLTHVLRHTFASHFMMNGGNILVLQRLLGHSNLTMTMRYAHLSPDHLQEARTLNPLEKLSEF